MGTVSAPRVAEREPREKCPKRRREEKTKTQKACTTDFTIYSVTSYSGLLLAIDWLFLRWVAGEGGARVPTRHLASMDSTLTPLWACNRTHSVRFAFWWSKCRIHPYKKMHSLYLRGKAENILLHSKEQKTLLRCAKHQHRASMFLICAHAHPYQLRICNKFHAKFSPRQRG